MVSSDYIVGFVDGEGCFCVSISIHKTLRRKREVRPVFEIELREDDLEILKSIQVKLGCGTIYRLDYKRYTNWKPHVKFKVSRINDLTTHILPFFRKHPLQAKKRNSFTIFAHIVEMVARKEHLTDKGFKEILKLREQMNP